MPAAITSATLTYRSLILYFDRPRGYLCFPSSPLPSRTTKTPYSTDSDSFSSVSVQPSNPSSSATSGSQPPPPPLPTPTLQIRPSQIPNAGWGLYTTRSLPSGTILGSYPGVLRPAASFYENKCRTFPRAVNYSWRFTDDRVVLDPTDEYGEIGEFCWGGSEEVPLSRALFRMFRILGTLMPSLFRVPTALARINEPPIGAGGCNVSAREDLKTREVIFELCRDVVAGEELFMDYGLGYDRSGYGGSL